MKRNDVITLVVLAFVSALSSCFSAHKIQGVNLNGKWLLDSVKVEGSDTNYKFKTTVFNDVSSECLNGSVWNLFNNGNGYYTVQASLPDCRQGERQIYWSVRNDNGVNCFQFKKLDNSTRPKNIEEGYRMEISSVTDNTLVLRSPANVDNQTVYIVYSFTRQ